MKACTKCGETKALSEFHRHGDGQRPDCKVCRIKSVEAYRASNPDKAKAISAAWAKANPDKLNAKNAKRNASKRKAIPIWADKNKIDIIYAKARECKMDVDHIIPLQSKIVCGLHTWDNLQLLHSSQNSSKQNLHWPDMPSI